GLLVTAAHHVVAEHPPGAGDLVIAGEERDDRQPLEGERELVADQPRQERGLPLQREGDSFDLLVMLELYLEEPHHVDGETGDTGNGDPRRPVGRKDL